MTQLQILDVAQFRRAGREGRACLKRHLWCWQLSSVERRSSTKTLDAITIPASFSGLLCGAGIRGGAVYGKSDDVGHSPDEDSVQPSDFNATIAAAMGLPLTQEYIAPNGRPFKICDNGAPISKLLA